MSFQQTTLSRYEEEKRELHHMIETLRDTADKCGKLNVRLEEELEAKVG